MAKNNGNLHRGRQPGNGQAYNRGNPAQAPARNEMIVPIPLSIKNSLENDTANFSLGFTRLVEWEGNRESIKNSTRTIPKIAGKSEKQFPSAKKGLDVIHTKQKAFLESRENLGLCTFEFKARLVSPFITGLGSGHPTETGMILDRNTGLPFIPASSVKGVLRLAHAVNIADGKEIVSFEKLRKYFGDADQKKENLVRGQIVFMDVYPEEITELSLDIMNPHFSKYYSGEGDIQPVETELPIPVKFLTVPSGEKFYFRGYCLPVRSNAYIDNRFTDEDKTAICAMFERAFTDIGFGGKTSIGYGRFKMLPDS